MAVTAGAQIGDQDYGGGEQQARKSDIEDLASRILDSGAIRVLHDSTPTSLKSDLKKIQAARATAVAYAKKYLDADASAAVKEIYDIIHSEYSSRWNLKNITDPITRKERETQHTDAEMENVFHRDTEGTEVLPAADGNEEPTVTPVGQAKKKVARATVRVAGHPPVSKVFPTEGEARKWAVKKRAELLAKNKKKAATKPISPVAAHVKAAVGKGAPASAPTAVSHAEIEQKIAKSKRHPSGNPQSTSQVMRGPQFHEWLDRQKATHSPEVLQAVFGGGDGDVKQNVSSLKRAATGLDKKNSVYQIAKLQKWYEKKLNDFEGIERKKAIFDHEFAANLAKAKLLDPDIERKLKPWRDDPKKLSKMARAMNKAVRNSYNLEMRTQKIGSGEITQIIRKVSIPEITKTDLDVIRANEQMGLAAIHRQHLYGRKYGKFNTMALALRDIVTPFILWRVGSADMIPHIKKLIPMEWFDAAYFAFIEPPIPRIGSGGRGFAAAPQLARTHRTEIGRKMFSVRQKKLMKGFDQDQIMPPDRAIMHAQWGPTTKQPWSKVRKQELMKRHKQATAPPSGDSWRKGFLRR